MSLVEGTSRYALGLFSTTYLPVPDSCSVLLSDRLDRATKWFCTFCGAENDHGTECVHCNAPKVVSRPTVRGEFCVVYHEQGGLLYSLSKLIQRFRKDCKK